MDTDRGLMRRIKRRDEAAFAHLVTRHGRAMLAVASRLLGSRADAEDAVQRAFLQCLTRAADYQETWAVSTWLYRILTNICVDEIRRRRTRPVLPADRDAVARRADRPDGGGGAEAAGRRIDVERALQRVPTEARALLVLRYVDGLSYGELARVRGITVNTVKSQLSRGKSILRSALGDGEGR